MKTMATSAESIQDVQSVVEPETAVVTSTTGDGLTVVDGRASVPAGLEGVPERAFCSDTTITEIALHSSVARIGRNAFHGCTSLATLQLPTSVTRVCEHAFHGCSALTEVTLGDGCVKIGDHAFCDCTSLTTIVLPPSVKEIGWSAFEGTAITHIAIPPTVVKIGGFAFDRCYNLKMVEVPASTEINDQTFDKSTKVLRLPPGRTVREKTQHVDSFKGLGFRPFDRHVRDMSHPPAPPVYKASVYGSEVVM